MTINDLLRITRNLKSQDSWCQFREPGNTGRGNAERKSIKIARASSSRAACRMWLLHGAVVRFYAHGTSRRSNPPSRASREQPVATLLLTSLRLLPPLSLHPDSRLVRIVAYGVAALVGATPSGSTGIPFHSVQPFNDAPDCLSNLRPSASLSTICIPFHPSQLPRQMRTRRLQINDTNFSRMLLFSHSSLLSSPLKTFKLQVCSFHFPDNTVLYVLLFTRSRTHEHEDVT